MGDPLTPAQLWYSRIQSLILINLTTGCWEFQGAINAYGYGCMRNNGPRHVMVHRVTYEHFKGAIPAGYVIDHLCRNHACCNPVHLEAVTTQENTRRGISPITKGKHKEKCKYGHTLSPDNVCLSTTKTGRIVQRCKQCVNEHSRKPEIRAAATERTKQWRNKPENADKIKEHGRKQRMRPGHKERQAIYLNNFRLRHKESEGGQL